MLHLEGGRPDFRKIALCLMITLVPAGLIALQPDLDGAIFTVIYALFVLFFRGYELENHWRICGERSNARTNSVVFRDGSLPKKAV